MSQKLTLTRYLRGGGEVKTLTRIEALVFGIPYPLQPGWPRKYGPMEITDQMVEDVRARIAVAKESTARSARRRLDGIDAEASIAIPTQNSPVPRAAAPLETKVSPVSGFVLRLARRYRARKPTTWGIKMPARCGL
jgi:hypothetical protein